MVRLREIPRTASFAWSSSTLSPQLVTGTKAGAVDADFSNETVLEIWDLDLTNTNATGELQPSTSLAVDSRLVIGLQGLNYFLIYLQISCRGLESACQWS
jgi:protein transport protein SEC31